MNSANVEVEELGTKFPSKIFILDGLYIENKSSLRYFNLHKGKLVIEGDAGKTKSFYVSNGTGEKIKITTKSPKEAGEWSAAIEKQIYQETLPFQLIDVLEAMTKGTSLKGALDSHIQSFLHEDETIQHISNPTNITVPLLVHNFSIYLKRASCLSQKKLNLPPPPSNSSNSRVEEEDDTFDSSYQERQQHQMVPEITPTEDDEFFLNQKRPLFGRAAQKNPNDTLSVDEIRSLMDDNQDLDDRKMRRFLKDQSSVTNDQQASGLPPIPQKTTSAQAMYMERRSAGEEDEYEDDQQAGEEDDGRGSMAGSETTTKKSGTGGLQVPDNSDIKKKRRSNTNAVDLDSITKGRGQLEVSTRPVNKTKRAPPKRRDVKELLSAVEKEAKMESIASTVDDPSAYVLVEKSTAATTTLPDAAKVDPGKKPPAGAATGVKLPGLFNPFGPGGKPPAKPSETTTSTSSVISSNTSANMKQQQQQDQLPSTNTTSATSATVKPKQPPPPPKEPPPSDPIDPSSDSVSVTDTNQPPIDTLQATNSTQVPHLNKKMIDDKKDFIMPDELRKKLEKRAEASVSTGATVSTTSHQPPTSETSSSSAMNATGTTASTDTSATTATTIAPNAITPVNKIPLNTGVVKPQPNNNGDIKKDSGMSDELRKKMEKKNAELSSPKSATTTPTHPLPEKKNESPSVADTSNNESVTDAKNDQIKTTATATTGGVDMGEKRSSLKFGIPTASATGSSAADELKKKLEARKQSSTTESVADSAGHKSTDHNLVSANTNTNASVSTSTNTSTSAAVDADASKKKNEFRKSTTNTNVEKPVKPSTSAESNRKSDSSTTISSNSGVNTSSIGGGPSDELRKKLEKRSDNTTVTTNSSSIPSKATTTNVNIGGATNTTPEGIINKEPMKKEEPIIKNDEVKKKFGGGATLEKKDPTTTTSVKKFEVKPKGNKDDGVAVTSSPSSNTATTVAVGGTATIANSGGNKSSISAVSTSEDTTKSTVTSDQEATKTTTTTSSSTTTTEEPKSETFSFAEMKKRAMLAAQQQQNTTTGPPLKKK